MSNFERALQPQEIAQIRDEDLDFSEIPELDEAFWKEAELVEPDRTEQISLRVKLSVLKWFRSSGKGYQTRMNRVLETYVRAQQRGHRRKNRITP